MKRATYEDVLNAPEHQVAEILDGELFLSPRPAPRQLVASSRLRGALEPFDNGQQGRGRWWILLEPEFHIGEDVLVPDLGGWRRERLPAIPDAAFFSLALMPMRVFSARVQNGTIVPDEGVELVDGSRVTVIAGEFGPPFEVSAEDGAELAAAIAEADRGDVTTASELFRRLAR